MRASWEREIPQLQWARHATSTDLTHWEDIPEDKFGADGKIYRMSDWRDPFAFWNEEEEKWWMLLAARENAPTERNGCVALCVSDDLSKWEYRPPLYAPRLNQAANECPDLFKMGDDLQAISDYLEDLETDLYTVDTVFKTGNPMTDTILNSRIALANDRGIRVEADAHIPALLNFSAVDLCTILGNLFDNAIEASVSLTPEPRVIRVYTDMKCV